ncbi:hypothetical protein V8C40DRAFT_245682, partial [Trichoderma camerunense]
MAHLLPFSRPPRPPSYESWRTGGAAALPHQPATASNNSRAQRAPHSKLRPFGMWLTWWFGLFRVSALFVRPRAGLAELSMGNYLLECMCLLLCFIVALAVQV